MRDLPFVRELVEPHHPSWEAFLSADETAEALAFAEQGIAGSEGEIVPPTCKALRFLETDLRGAKIIILGQDPYPQSGAATGRCFEVGTLTSWEDTFRNVSLKNIVRAIYASQTDSILSYKQILAQVAQGWPLLPPQLLFRDWERQGVLLLNTAFTCQLGAAGSHTDLWRPFTALLLRYICEANPQLIWFVWGKHAEKHTADLAIANKMVSQHPMMCYEGDDRKDDFLYGEINMFRKTAHLVQWTGTDFAQQTKGTARGLFY